MSTRPFRIPFVVIAALACLTLFFCADPEVRHHTPVIEQLGRFSVTITWRSDKAVKGKVYYAVENGRESVVAESAAVVDHRLTITGLSPQKRYTYRIGNSAGPSYHFTAAPPADAPFRFCLVTDTAVSPDSIALAHPDFVVVLHPSLRDSLAPINALMPVYAPSSPFSYAGYSFEWDMQGCADSSSRGDDQPGFIFLSHGDSSPDSVCVHSSTVVVTPIHADSFSVAPVGAAVKLGAPAGTIVFEVQGGEIRAGSIAEAASPPVLVRRASLSYTRTCVYCRRLMESRQYHESIEWYKRFIADNPGEAMLDDALYQVAHIYDTYLSEYDSALSWYAALIDRFPHSASASSARFRRSYIEAHSDHDYEPLRIFERARLTYQSDRRASIYSVSEAVERYSRSTLGSEMRMWLGNVCARDDHQNAIRHLSHVRATHPGQLIAYQAGLAIGDIHYIRRDFKAGRAVYESLLDEFPSKAADLEVKIMRSRRNNTRRTVLFTCIAFALAFMTTTALMRPRGLALPPWKVSTMIGAIYLLAVVAPVPFLSSDLTVLGPFAVVLVAALSAAAYFVLEAGRKTELRIRSRIVRVSIMVPPGAVLGFCAFYITAYFFHYLFVFDGMF